MDTLLQPRVVAAAWPADRTRAHDLSLPLSRVNINPGVPYCVTYAITCCNKKKYDTYRGSVYMLGLSTKLDKQAKRGVLCMLELSKKKNGHPCPFFLV
jgi:hypothetical protein